jgi:S-adenosylmethionine uptake transporter
MSDRPLSHPLLPFAVAGLGICVFSMMDAAMKSASLQVGAYNALLFRSLIGTAIMLPVWRLSGGRWPGRGNLKVHMLRSTVVAGMAWLFFWGLVRIPLAEGIALSFIAPLIALFLAAVLLGEQIQRRAILASLLGLAGVGVIGAGRFGSGHYETDAAWGVAAVLVSAVLYAWNLILQRQQALLAGPREVALFQHMCVAVVLALLAPWLAELPPPAALGTIALGAVLAASALMLLSWAYARAEAQALVAVEYTAFIWAALTGWFFFGEAVTGWTVAGVVLIVAGCWIAARKPTEQTAL